MASDEEQRLLEDAETSSEISAAAIYSVQEDHNFQKIEVSENIRSGSQGFIPVEVSQLNCLRSNI